MDPKRISILELMRVIEHFVSDAPVVNSRAWYKTEKEHWIGWLGNFGGSGYRGKVVVKRDAEYAYNHALSPEMLLYLIHSIPLNLKQVNAAERACAKGSGRVELLNAIHKVLPWSAIYQAIWGESKRPRANRDEAPSRQNSRKSKKQPKERTVGAGVMKPVHDLPVGVQNLALSIRQPYAELILRGKKKIEYRSTVARIRSRVYLYASLTPVEKAYEEMGSKPGDFPTGVIVGTIEIIDCTGYPGDYEWHLGNPERWARTVKSQRHPQPVWFKPFEKEE